MTKSEVSDSFTTRQRKLLSLLEQSKLILSEISELNKNKFPVIYPKNHFKGRE